MKDPLLHEDLFDRHPTLRNLGAEIVPPTDDSVQLRALTDGYMEQSRRLQRAETEIVAFLAEQRAKLAEEISRIGRQLRAEDSAP